MCGGVNRGHLRGFISLYRLFLEERVRAERVEIDTLTLISFALTGMAGEEMK